MSRAFDFFFFCCSVRGMRTSNEIIEKKNIIFHFSAVNCERVFVCRILKSVRSLAACFSEEFMKIRELSHRRRTQLEMK